MEEGKDICVHGIPVHVSPKKESRDTKGLYYFDAKLSDGKKCARLVSFDNAHRDAIKKAEEDQSVVALSRSIVKKSSVSSALEVHINKRSRIMLSTRELLLGDFVASPLGSTVKTADIALLMTGKDSEVGVKRKMVKVDDLSTVKV